MPLEPEHAAARMKGIGGSELATVLHEYVAESGDKAYGCPLALYFEKRGVPADYPFEETGPVLRGIALEPMIANMYQEETGHTIRRLRHKVNKERSWEMVSIDRQIVGEPAGPGVLECKSVGQAIWFQIKAKGLPLSFVLQVQWGYHVLGPQYKWGAIAFLWADGWEYHSYPVERDQELIDLMAAKVAAFWKGVETESPPKKLKYKDPRCQACRWRSSCQGDDLIEAAGQDIESFEEADIDDALAPKVHHRMELKSIEKETEALRIEVEGEIVEGMGGREIVVAGGHRIIHKTIPGGFVVDTKRMKKNAPKVFDKWKKPKKDSKPLKFYPV